MAKPTFSIEPVPYGRRNKVTVDDLNEAVNNVIDAIYADMGGGGSGDMLKSVYDTNNDGTVDAADAAPWAGITGKPGTFPPSSHGHPTSEITGLDTALAAKAPLASPALTGTPTAPTPASGDNSTRIATTAFVLGEVAGGGGGDMLKSVYDTDNDGTVDAADAAPWAGITGKPSTFAPSSHTHPTSEVTGLDSALAAKAPLASPALTGNPTAPTQTAGNNTTRIATTAFVQGEISGLGTGDMLKSVYDSNDDGTVDAADAAPWAGITGKPSTFTPSAHTHTLSEITDAGTAAGQDSSAFAAASHTHPAADISDSTASGRALLTAANAGAQRTALGLGSAAQSDTGDFAAASHSHAISDVTGLQTALDGKAASSHTHNANDINAGTLDAARLPASVLRDDTDDTLTAGYAATSDDDGTQSSGTYTPTYAGGNLKKIVNGGAFTFAAPTASGEYTLVIAVTNNASAGAITFTGFDKQSGDSLTTTNGHGFHLYITKLAGKVGLNVQAMQ